jgi:hypothetical protein
MQGRYRLPLAIGVPLLAVARSRLDHTEHRIVSLLASGAILLLLGATATVYRGAWVRFADLVRYRYASLGQAFLILGALAVLTNIAWTEIRWSLANRSRALGHAAGEASGG